MFSSASLIPSLLADLNLNYALAGTITSAYMLALSVALLPIGSIGDRIGGRALTLAGLCSIFLGSALFAVATTYPVAMAGRVLIGAGAAAALVLPPPMLAFWFAKSEYRTVVGFHTSIGKMGSVVATWVLPPLIMAFGWRLGYGTVSLVCPLALLVAFLFLLNEPKDVGLGRGVGMAVSPAVRPKGRQSERRASLLAVVRNRNVVLMGVCEMLLFANYFGLINWMPTYFKTVVGASEVQAGFQTGFVLWGTIIGYAASGPLANFLGSCRPLYSAGLAAATVLSAVFAGGLLPLMPSWAWSPLMLTYGLCVSVMVMVLPILTTLVPVRSLGTAGGFALMVGYLGAMASPPAMGAIADATGSLAASFWLPVGATLLGFVVSLGLREGTAADRAEPL